MSKMPTKNQVKVYLKRSLSQQLEDSRLIAFYCNKTQDELINLLPSLVRDKKRSAIVSGLLQYLERCNTTGEVAPAN